jgi:hypothetical protein
MNKRFVIARICPANYRVIQQATRLASESPYRSPAVTSGDGKK